LSLTEAARYASGSVWRAVDHFPKIDRCPKCNVAFGPVQVKESGSAAGIIGWLLIFLGIIGWLLIFLGIIDLMGTLVGAAASFGGGLALIGLGILVRSVGGRESGLMCPNCRAHAATLSELATNRAS
jgi:hypothetical protein